MSVCKAMPLSFMSDFVFEYPPPQKKSILGCFVFHNSKLYEIENNAFDWGLIKPIKM